MTSSKLKIYVALFALHILADSIIFSAYDTEQTMFAPAEKSTSLIINGIKANQRPFYARILSNRSKKFCGATVIDFNWVVTSANCIANNSC